MKVTKNDAKEAFEEAKRRVEAMVIESLQYVGEKAVNAAINNTQPKKNPDGTPGGGTSYLDQSSNLRSSIGYIIMKDGVEINNYGFKPTRPTATAGSGAGYSFAENIASKYPDKYVLIIVAGMNYATYVEKNDYDVLTFVESEARANVKQVFDNIKV